MISLVHVIFLPHSPATVMADGHGDMNSARTRKASRILAESLTNVTASCDDKYVSDISVLPTDGGCCKDLEICEELAVALASTSSEIVINNLSKKYSLKRLTNLRDSVASLCRKAREECPKGRLVRRLARQVGPKVEVKLANDIVVLIKYWKSGEETQQVQDLFYKSNLTPDANSSVIIDDGRVSSEDLLRCMENIEAKIVETSTRHKAEIDKLKEELDNTRFDLVEKSEKIHYLET